MLRRLYQDQPDSFAFTPDNQTWAEAQVTKYPPGRQASAIIPLLWRAQEQEGWLTRPAIEHVADMLGMDYIRALEVASFYFMFQLQPVGSVAHIQVCGTTSCMICGAEDLVAVCKEKIAPKPHQLSEDGKLSWEEVECLGACANAPMAQIGKDYYEDLSAARMAEMIDELSAGKTPVPGSQTGRYAAEPITGLTSLTEYEAGKAQYNASVAAAVEIGDTIKRIDGTEVPLLAPWGAGQPTHIDPDAQPEQQPKAKSKTPDAGEQPKTAPEGSKATKSKGAKKKTEAKAAPGSVSKTSVAGKAEVKSTATPPEKPESTGAAKPVTDADKPDLLSKARDGGPDDLKMIKGVGPKLEQLLHTLGVFHFDQVASWREGEVAWVDENLKGFKGRVTRDEWVKQAKTLAKGGSTEFSSRVKKGGVYE